ncbi:protein moonraker isoform X2 [Lingula anatina]|uniref:Protein moonraker isoform X2 n=1 Tax=Lingula anatina TaxID=7574 RepID=A0A1S3JPG1_LINAN|nr:protein moonraker isoform X2 [Lingula anatina]|eukprot:XP_013412021.1 protein moonraker isoform X2 [Lingula anatina]
MAAVSHFKNQLQFNLNVPPVASNLAMRFQKPEAIVVEKLSSSPPRRPPLLTTATPPIQPASAFKFSVVSEDSLTAAVRLAKRDLKKKKIEEQFYLSSLAHEAKQTEKAQKTQIPKVKVKKSKEYREKVQSRQDDVNEKPLVLREKDAKNKSVKQAKIQTRSKVKKTTDDAVPNIIVHMGKKSLPVSTQSPPTRDTDGYVPMVSPSARHAQEISRLRTELQRYMEQIRKSENRNENVAPHVEKTDDVDEQRRAKREGERASRTSRMLYVLQQQVREIQEELSRIGPEKVKHNKKSRTLHRLAAAHRGAVKAIQAYVNHLPEEETRHGMPKLYQELALLIRQLSLCCAELEVGGESGVPDVVKNILGQAGDLNESIEKELQSSPLSPKARRALRDQSEKQISPVSRQLFPEEAMSARIGPATVARLRQDMRWRDVDDTPDRDRVLRAGIEALERASRNNPARDQRPVNPLVKEVISHERRPWQQSGRGLGEEDITGIGGETWNAPFDIRDRGAGVRAGQTRSVKKSVLLPSKLQTQRIQAQHQAAPILNQAHFAEHTYASRAKVVHSPRQYRDRTGSAHSPRSSSAPASPERHMHRGEYPDYPRPRSLSSDRSPRIGDRSPRLGERRPWLDERSPRPILRNPMTPYREREIRRQLWLDREAARQTRNTEMARHLELDRFRKTRAERQQARELVSEAEAEIRRRLQPLLKQAQEISETHAAEQRLSQQSLRHRLSDKITEQVEVNTDILSDMILSDIIRDTAEELEDIRTNKKMEGQRHSNLESMLHRLEQIESERDEIRRRWTTVDYNDAASREEEIEDVPVLPQHPVPIHVSKSDQEQQRRQAMAFLQPVPQTRRQSTPERSNLKDLIVFTKKTQDRDAAHRLSQMTWEQKEGSIAPTINKVKLHMPQEQVESIKEYREQFERHLKRVSHQAVGKFDPWKLVEDIADEIVDSCVEGVAQELDNINSEIAGYVFSTEFAAPPVTRPPLVSQEVQVQSKLHPNFQGEKQSAEQDDDLRQERKAKQFKWPNNSTEEGSRNEEYLKQSHTDRSPTSVSTYSHSSKGDSKGKSSHSSLSGKMSMGELDKSAGSHNQSSKKENLEKDESKRSEKSKSEKSGKSKSEKSQSSRSKDVKEVLKSLSGTSSQSKRSEDIKSPLHSSAASPYQDGQTPYEIGSHASYSQDNDHVEEKLENKSKASGRHSAKEKDNYSQTSSAGVQSISEVMEIADNKSDRSEF